ncbi:hypothetical protein TcasGA2_TC034563 [Tribolium castaneum]|uniref:Uncharacterized protein n=1 Tax=Tribolium castaneum TaxID=7070 RepID=A0A139WMY9_TRICA|nr:hypothetical protein TcasGA2_TC034563 [Tribolium castaneum]
MCRSQIVNDGAARERHMMNTQINIPNNNIIAVTKLRDRKKPTSSV